MCYKLMDIDEFIYENSVLHTKLCAQIAKKQMLNDTISAQNRINF